MSLMRDDVRAAMKTELALALGRGVSVLSWAKANKVPKSTAYNWATDPEVRSLVESCRRGVLDHTIGRMVEHFNWVADTIIADAQHGKSDPGRLRAARAMFSDMINVSKYSELEDRVSQIEQKLGAEPRSFTPLLPRQTKKRGSGNRAGEQHRGGSANEDRFARFSP